MPSMILTTASSVAKVQIFDLNIDESTVEQIYPCRCGQVHRGDYAQETYLHHQCLHEADLILVEAGSHQFQAICPLCGMTWRADLT